MNSLITFNSTDVIGGMIYVTCLHTATIRMSTILIEYDPCYLGNKQRITELKLT
jgi:hypothetical protein